MGANSCILTSESLRIILKPPNLQAPRLCGILSSVLSVFRIRKDHQPGSRPEETMVARVTKGVAFLSFLTLLAAGLLAPQSALAQNFITVDYPGSTLTAVR